MNKKKIVLAGILLFIVLNLFQAPAGAACDGFDDYIIGWNGSGDKILFIRVSGSDEDNAEKQDGVYYFDLKSEKVCQISGVPAGRWGSLNWRGNNLVYCDKQGGSFKICSMTIGGDEKTKLLDIFKLFNTQTFFTDIGRISFSPDNEYIAFNLKRQLSSSGCLFNTDKNRDRDKVEFYKESCDIYVYGFASKTIKRVSDSLTECIDPK